MTKWKITTPKDFESTNDEYCINGRKYCRVTVTLGVIAKHRLMSWMGRVGEKEANKVLETRQNIGITTHKLIEWTLKGELFNLGTYETEIQESMCKFYEFRTLANLKPDALEQRLWSNEFGFAGTADYIGKYKTVEKFLVRTQIPKFKDGAFVIGDWKTAKDFYPTYRLQLAAYAMAFKELTGIQVDGAFICLIRNGKLKVKELTWDELVEEFEVYKALLIVYKWWKPEK
jgi:predicted RecB family nuclease